MFSWFKKRKPTVTTNPKAVDASPKPGDRFRWPKDVIVTAIDDVVLAVPIELLEPNESMGKFIFAPEEMQIDISDGEHRIYLKLDVGMNVRIAKTVECLVCGEDSKPRRIHLRKLDSKT